MGQQKGSALLLVLFIFLFVALGVTGYFYFTRSFFNTKPTQPSQVAVRSENAKRTIFKSNGQQIFLTEESKRYSDGSLETVVKSEGKKLSHQLFLQDKILSLRDGILSKQIFKSAVDKDTYKTAGENFLNVIIQNPNLSKKTVNLNGEKVTVYTVGSSVKKSFNLITEVFAQEDPSLVTNIYVDQESGELQKIENIEPSSSNPTEEIVYDDGPYLMDGKVYPAASEPPVDESGPYNVGDKLYPQESSASPTQAPESSANLDINSVPPPPTAQLEQEAVRVEEAVISSPPVAPKEAMVLFPFSVIPVDNGYNNLYARLISTSFRVKEFADKSIKEKNLFETEEFVKQNIKVRVDGKEIVYQNSNIDAGIIVEGQSESVTFVIPTGLQPGYHTIEVFVVDSWFLAPSLLVVLPQLGEAVLNLEITNPIPPTGKALPNNQGYEFTLSGKNLTKPFTVFLTDTSGKIYPVDDKNVRISESNGVEYMTLLLSSSLNHGIYSLTIVKEDQTIYRPNYIILER